VNILLLGPASELAVFKMGKQSEGKGYKKIAEAENDFYLFEITRTV
jgi:hypothetical protein